jgi:hypothetical protein
VLHVFANLNDCMVSNTWQMKHRLKDEDMYDLVREMRDFIDPIFVVTAEARR